MIESALQEGMGDSERALAGVNTTTALPALILRMTVPMFDKFMKRTMPEREWC